MNIIVTGGAGFIGSHIVDELIQKGHNVSIIDNLSRGNIKNVNKKANFYKLDINSKKINLVFKKEKPDVINHQAAMINVRESVDKPLEYEKNNTLGLVNILENCRKYKVKKIINISSGGVVYGTPKKMPPNESYPFDPQSPYGITKVEGEYWCQYYQKNFDITYTSLRYANVYGPRQETTGGAGVIAIFTKLMLKNKQPIIFGDGTIKRDYVYIDDVVKANIKCLNSGDNQSFNIGTGTTQTINQIFNIIKKYTHCTAHAKYIDRKIGELNINYLNVAKANKLLKWQAQTNINDGIKKTVDYYKKY
jgi:UDP-glucose 4-epimerase